MAEDPAEQNEEAARRGIKVERKTLLDQLADYVVNNDQIEKKLSSLEDKLDEKFIDNLRLKQFE